MALSEQYIFELMERINVREKKARNKAILYTSIPLILAILLIWITASQVVTARGDLAVIENRLDSTKKEIAVQVQILELLKSAVPSALEDFGWSKEKLTQTAWNKYNSTNYIIDTSYVAQSLHANIKLTEAVARNLPSSNNITVQYFPKDLDSSKVDKALKALGFKLQRSSPVVTITPTNSIWIGSSVDIDQVRHVAYTLIRAGVQIRAIRYFRQPDGSKTNLIQVGADVQVVNEPYLKVDDIYNMTLDDSRLMSQRSSGKH